MSTRLVRSYDEPLRAAWTDIRSDTTDAHDDRLTAATVEGDGDAAEGDGYENGENEYRRLE